MSIHAETTVNGHIAIVLESSFGDMTRAGLTLEAAKTLRAELDALIKQEEFLAAEAEADFEAQREFYRQ